MRGAVQEDLRARVLDYIQRHNTMTIATCEGNRPWAAAVFYTHRAFVFYYLSDPNSDHSRHVAANPEVALAIHEDYRDWREIKGVQIQGTAAMVTDPSEIEDAWRLYLAKYPFVENWLLRLARPLGLGRLARAAGDAVGDLARRVGSVRFYRVAARRVLYTDNSMGFGHREELSLHGEEPS